jgi:DNA-binding PadR family transcriptional regulator
MKRTSIDANELKSIGSRLISLAEKYKNTTEVTNQGLIYSEYQFSDKERLVFEYIKKNPGTIQEDVVKNVHEYSRVTILKTISALEKEGIIKVEVDERNSKKYRLFINNQNVLASLTQDLDYFQESFFNLVKETNIVLKSFTDSRSHRRKGWKLLDALIMPYKALINTCILSDLIFANRVTIDTNTLHKKFSIIFAELSAIQIKLYDSISTISRWYGEDEIQTKLFNDKMQSLTPENIYDMLHTFEEYNLSTNIQFSKSC